MRCESCGGEARHELIEVSDGHVVTMHFCGNCLPDRVRGMAGASPIQFSSAQRKGDDLHLWLSITAEAAKSSAVLRLADDVEINFPIEDGEVFQFEGKAAGFRADCSGDLFVHVAVHDDYNQW